MNQNSLEKCNASAAFGFLTQNWNWAWHLRRWVWREYKCDMFIVWLYWIYLRVLSMVNQNNLERCKTRIVLLDF